MTVTSQLARLREGSGRSTGRKEAKKSNSRLTKRARGSRMKGEVVQYRAIAKWKWYIDKDQKTVETL